MTERIYKKMEGAGVVSLVLGIITLISATAIGVLLIVNAARVLGLKKEVLI